MMVETIIAQDSKCTAEERRSLDAISSVLEIGWSASFRGYISFLGSALQTSASPQVRREYAEILKKAQVLFRFEELHGQGCLLNVDNPRIQELQSKRSRNGFRLISPTEIENAKRFRQLRAQVSD